MASKIRQNYYGLDIAKLVAAVFVIGSHTHPLTGLEGSLIYTIYNFFSPLAVPLFALASGYLLSRKLQWNSAAEADTTSIRKTLRRMIQLYLIWSLIYLPIAFQEPISPDKPLYLVFVRYMINLIFVGEHYLSWHLWYLLAIIYGLVLLLLMRKWNCKPWMVGASSLAIYSFSYWLYGYIAAPDRYTGIWYTLCVVVGEVFLDGRLFSGIGYFILGTLFGRLTRFPSFVPCLLTFLLGLFLRIFGLEPASPFLRYLSSPVYASALFLLCLTWNGTKIRPGFTACRSASTVFYFTHMLFYYVGDVLLGSIFSFPFWGAPAFFWCLLTSSLAAALVYKFRGNKIVAFLF